eukprot:364906-Chlamydomonas_euryale.AAC.9
MTLRPETGSCSMHTRAMLYIVCVVLVLLYALPETSCPTDHVPEACEPRRVEDVQDPPTAAHI